MSSSLTLLPVLERWDCHHCTVCCRGTIIPLDDEDLAKIRGQRWHEHPDLRGARVVVRQGPFSRRYQLGRRKDGSCVFLLPDGLCRIHRDFGAAAKPKTCRAFPFQAVPQQQGALVVARRSCPSAAAGRGRPVEESREDVQEAIALRPAPPALARPPEIVRGVRRPWHDALRIAESFERLLRAEGYPLVRRVVHAVLFCESLASCRPARLDSRGIAELLGMLEAAALREAGAWFQGRRAPERATAMLFRRTAVEYVRQHPKVRLAPSWSGRWQWVRTALAIGRGRGRIPPLGPELQAVGVETLDRPLGPLPDDVLAPLDGYFQAASASRRYSFLARKDWPLVDAFRALVISYPVAMWLARLSAPEGAPTAGDVTDAVVALDRGEGLAALCGRQHRRRLALLSRLGELARLVAWYGR